jgi:hypothetical protein
MRSLLLGCAAFLILAANAPQLSAFETEYSQGTNPSASARYADPDEQFDEMADSAGSSGSVLIYNFGSEHSSSQPTAAVADQSVHWSAERIRTVFGPDAHY